MSQPCWRVADAVAVVGGAAAAGFRAVAAVFHAEEAAASPGVAMVGGAVFRAAVMVAAEVTRAGAGVPPNGLAAVLAGVTSPAHLAVAAIFPRPTSQVEVSRVLAAAHGPAVVECPPAVHSDLRLAPVLQLAAKRHSYHQEIGRVAEKELDLLVERNLLPARSRRAVMRGPVPVIGRLSFPLKDLVTFWVRRPAPALVPPSAERSAMQPAIARVSSRQIDAALGNARVARVLSSVQTGAIDLRTVTTNGRIVSITAVKPGTSGVNSVSSAATNLRTTATSAGINWRAPGKIVRNGATSAAKIGSNIAKTFGITGQIVPTRFGTMRRTSMTMSSMMPGGVMVAGAVTGPATITRWIPGGGGAHLAGAR